MNINSLNVWPYLTASIIKIINISEKKLTIATQSATETFIVITFGTIPKKRNELLNDFTANGQLIQNRTSKEICRNLLNINGQNKFWYDFSEIYSLRYDPYAILQIGQCPNSTCLWVSSDGRVNKLQHYTWVSLLGLVQSVGVIKF